MRIALLSALTLAFVCGGFGVTSGFNNAALASSMSDKGHDAKEDASKEDEEEKGGHAKGAKFVELDPLMLPIVDETGVSQVVSIIVSIQVPSEGKMKKVIDQTPRLKDAYIQDMYGVLNKHAALKGGVLQVSMIKQRLNKISQRVMGEGVVDDVLLQVVQQRRI